MSRLISFSGLPGVGKTTLARALSARINAIHLRADTVEAALKNSVLKIHPAEDAGYLVLKSLAKDNLLLGFDVIVDTVNPVPVSRKLWTDCAIEAEATLINIEVICEDERIHRNRVETRVNDIDGLIVPTWAEVKKRHYEPWIEDRIVLDTSKLGIPECVEKIAAVLA